MNGGNKEALEAMYSIAKTEGYEDSIDDFVGLMSNNKGALETMYNLAKREGYEDSIDDFSSLMGLKKKDAGYLSGTAGGQKDGGKSASADKVPELTPESGLPELKGQPKEVVEEEPKSFLSPEDYAGITEKNIASQPTADVPSYTPPEVGSTRKDVAEKATEEVYEDIKIDDVAARNRDVSLAEKALESDKRKADELGFDDLEQYRESAYNLDQWMSDREVRDYNLQKEINYLERMGLDPEKDKELYEELESMKKQQKEYRVERIKNTLAQIREIKSQMPAASESEKRELAERAKKLNASLRAVVRPVEAAKGAYQSNKEIREMPGDTPLEKLRNYYYGQIEKAKGLDMTAGQKLKAGVPYIFPEERQRGEEFLKTMAIIEELTPIVALNEKELSEDNWFTQMTKGTIGTMTSYGSDVFRTEQDQAQILFDVMDKAQVSGNLDESVADAIEESFNMTTGEKIGSTTGVVLGMVPAFMGGGATVRTAKNLSKVSKLIDKLGDSNKYAKALFGSRAGKFVGRAVEQGLSYEAAGFFGGSETIEDEASFLSGFLGETTLSLGKALLPKQLKAVYMSAMLRGFGNNARNAHKLMTKIAERSGQGFGEVLEEYGNEISSVIRESDGSLNDMRKLWMERFGTIDQNIEFGLMTFGMGAVMGMSTKSGQAFADSYNNWKSRQSEEVQAKFEEIEKDVNTGVSQAIEEVSKEAPKTRKEELEAELETIQDDNDPRIAEIDKELSEIEAEENEAEEPATDGEVVEESVPEEPVAEEEEQPEAKPDDVEQAPASENKKAEAELDESESLKDKEVATELDPDEVAAVESSMKQEKMANSNKVRSRYETAIMSGQMSVDDVVETIKTAGLEVPDYISGLKGKGVETVNKDGSKTIVKAVDGGSVEEYYNSKGEKVSETTTLGNDIKTEYASDRESSYFFNGKKVDEQAWDNRYNPKAEVETKTEAKELSEIDKAKADVANAKDSIAKEAAKRKLAFLQAKEKQFEAKRPNAVKEKKLDVKRESAAKERKPKASLSQEIEILYAQEAIAKTEAKKKTIKKRIVELLDSVPSKKRKLQEIANRAFRVAGSYASRVGAERAAEKLEKDAEKALKAIASIAPDVQIIVHKDESEYNNAVGVRNVGASATAFMNADGAAVVHINPQRANKRTVAHEAFHVVLNSQFKGNQKEIAKATKEMADSLRRTVDGPLKAYLDEFAAGYEREGEAIVNEEFVSELVGYLSGEYASIGTKARAIVRKWVDRIAELLGVKGLTPDVKSVKEKDIATVEMLDVLAEKIGKGEEISAEDVASELFGNPDPGFDGALSVAITSRNQATDIIRGKTKLTKYGLGRGRNLTRKVGEALEARQREKYGLIDRSDRSKKTRNRIATWMAAEVRYFADLMGDNSGKGWYGKLYQEALDVLTEIFPKMKDKESRKLFTMFLAVTSDGAKVNTNMKMATLAFQEYSKSGEVSPKIAEKISGNRNLVNNFKRINSLLERFDGDISKVSDYLNEVKLIGDINAERLKIGLSKIKSDWPPDFEIPVGAAYFGPKIGMFFANLSGNEAYPTLDRWWSRTFNRYRGTITPKVNRGFTKEGKPIGIDNVKFMLGDKSMSDSDVMAVIRDEAINYKNKNYKNGTALEIASNTIYKAAYVELNDIPFGPSDRGFMYETISEAAKRLNKEGGDYTIADIQAILWYFEKNLYKTLGVNAKIEGISYKNSAIQIVEAFKSKQGLAKSKLSDAGSDMEMSDENIRKNVAEARKGMPTTRNQRVMNQKPVSGNRLFNNPLPDAARIADKYMKQNNLGEVASNKITSLDKDLAKRISDAFDAMKPNPNDPAVAEAYIKMSEETVAQYESIIEEGYKVEINNNEPYSSSGEMIEDLRKNKRMKIFSTESGFGEEPITDQQRKDNPLLKDSGFKDVNGVPLLINDVFRFVHDFFGHAKLGNGFGPLGEENAWNVHSSMFSPIARKAMTTETRGQNSWVNFSGANDEAFKMRDEARRLRKEGKTEEANALVEKVYETMSFAEQKIGLLPDEFSTPITRNQRGTDWEKKTIETLPKSSFNTKSDFEYILNNRRWANLTGENPFAKSISEKANKEANKKAKEWLESRGFKPQPIFGKYGNAENSFFVEGMYRNDAAEFAREFGQESVATNEGLVYPDGSMNPIESIEVGGDYDNYYSVIDVAGEKVPYAIDYAEEKVSNIPEEIHKMLDDDGNGNYVFYHRSFEKRDILKPALTYGGYQTGREEAAALNSVGGVLFAYTQPDQSEIGMGPNVHIFRIPKDKIYYYFNDHAGFYNEAKRRFNKKFPGQAFTPNHQAAWITEVAKDNGFLGMVAKWRSQNELRAQFRTEFVPEEVQVRNQKPSISKVIKEAMADEELTTEDITEFLKEQGFSDKQIKSALDRYHTTTMADNHIRGNFKILFDESGKLKSKNQLTQQAKEIWDEFNRLKVWSAVKKFAENFAIDSAPRVFGYFRDNLAHLGTLSKILDRGGDFFTKNVYDKLNISNDKYLGGYQSQYKKLDEIAGKGKYDRIVKALDTKRYQFKFGDKKYSLTKDELLRVYALSKNGLQALKLKRLGFDEKVMERVKDILGNELTSFADDVVTYLSEDYFSQINDVYLDVNGVNLPRVNNYFPTRTDPTRIDEGMLVDGDFGSIFDAQHASALMDRDNTGDEVKVDFTFTGVLDDYFRSMERFKAMAPVAKSLTTLANVPSVNTLLEATGMKRAFKQKVNYAVNPDAFNSPSSGWLRMFSRFALAFKAVQLPKQATSFVNAFEAYTFRKGKPTPVVDLLGFMVDTAFNIATLPYQFHKAYKMSPTFRQRVKDSLQGRVYELETGYGIRGFKRARKRTGLLAKISRAWRVAGALPTIAGDMLGVMGYMANYNADIRNGMSQQDAVNKFNDYNSTQQTKRPTEKIGYQIEGNELSKTFLLFGSSSFLYLNKTISGMIGIMNSLKAGKMPSAKDVRGVVLSLGVANMLFVGVSNIAKYMFGDDDDKREFERKLREAGLGSTILFNIPLIGAAFEAMYNTYTGDRVFKTSAINPVLQTYLRMQRMYNKDQKLMSAARPVAEMALGTQFDPFIGIYNLIKEDVYSPNYMYDALGISYSYRPSAAQEELQQQRRGETYTSFKTKHPQLYDQFNEQFKARWYMEGNQMREDQIKDRQNYYMQFIEGRTNPSKKALEEYRKLEKKRKELAKKKKEAKREMFEKTFKDLL